MALNDTSSLALRASFPDLPADKRQQVEAALSPAGREIAKEIKRLQKTNGFVMHGASSPTQIAELYLNWARAVTVEASVHRRSKTKTGRSVQSRTNSPASKIP